MTEVVVVKIENFQSIKRVEFSIDGFTAFVGKSNIGKSSIVRALRCALTGARGTNFVRHDPKTCSRINKDTKKCDCFSSVKLDFGDGRVLFWKKGDNVNQYTTWEDGVKQVYSQIGQNPELPKMMRTEFAPVKVGKEKTLLQVSSQFTPLFLLDLPGTTVADVLSDVAKLDEINLAMKLVLKDRKESSATRKVRDQDIRILEKELGAYSDLDITESRVEAVSSLFLRLRDLTATSEKLEEYQSSLLATGADIKRLVRVTGGDLPDSLELRSRTSTFLDLARYYRDWVAKAKIYKKLSGVDTLAIPDRENLERMHDTHQRLSRWDTQRQKIEELIETYEKIPLLEVATSPEKFRQLSDSLRRIVFLRDRWETLGNTVKLASESLAALEVEEVAVRREFDGLGVCPACSQPVVPEHVLCGGT